MTTPKEKEARKIISIAKQAAEKLRRGKRLYRTELEALEGVSAAMGVIEKRDTKRAMLMERFNDSGGSLPRARIELWEND